MSTKTEVKVVEEPGWKKIGVKIILPILVFIIVFLFTFFIKMMDSGDLWPEIVEDFVFPTADKKTNIMFILIAINLASFYAGVLGGATYGIGQLL